MKALTVVDKSYVNSAKLLREGRMKIIAKRWKTTYRGDLLITSSNSSENEFAGKAFCVAELYDITNMKEEDESTSFIYFDKNLYSWHFRNFRPIEPFETKGKLGLFEIDLQQDLEYL